MKRYTLRELITKARNREIDIEAEYVPVSILSTALVPVPVGEPCPNTGYDFYMTPLGLGWIGYDKAGNECVETPDGYYAFRDCCPVRLVPMREALEGEG